jgi:hypothetical protein
MPYAVESQGNIVQLYDPIYHQKIDDEEYDSVAMNAGGGFDRRWFSANVRSSSPAVSWAWTCWT